MSFVILLMLMSLVRTRLYGWAVWDNRHRDRSLKILRSCFLIPRVAQKSVSTLFVLIKGLFIWAEVISVPKKNISTGQIMLFCSYGEMFSCLPGKVSRGDVDFVKCKQKVFPLSGKVVFILG